MRYINFCQAPHFFKKTLDKPPQMCYNKGTKKEKEITKMKYDWEEMYDMLRDYVGVPEEALDLALGISGCNEETACAILNYYTGWKSFEGYLGEFEDED